MLPERDTESGRFFPSLEGVMQCKMTALAFFLFLFLAPLAQTQTQSDDATLRGTVGEATQLSNGDLHVWLETPSGGGSEVCLGSGRFLEDQGFLPSVGDAIEITGVRAGGRSLLIANSLQIRGKTLTLSGTKTMADCPGCASHDCGGHDCGHHNCVDHDCCGNYGYHNDHE
jgi:hypothetical protein